MLSEASKVSPRQTATDIIRLFDKVPRPVALHEPAFSETDKKYILDCLASGWVSSAGPYVEQFSRDLQSFTGSYAVPVANGTAALHLCLHVAGVEEGDEVLMPALSFIATANAVRYCRAVPHFIDIEGISLGLDPFALKKRLQEIAEKRDGIYINKETQRRIKAVVAVHILGFPAQLEELQEICNEYGLKLIEDAAESLGSYYRGKHTGTFGLLSALSFNGNKIITTGGGGAVLTQSKSLAERVLHLSTVARVPDPYVHNHDEIGFNYRLPNINAALGCAQLERLPEYLVKKKRIADFYIEKFKDLSNLQFLAGPTYAVSNNWLCSVMTPSKDIRDRMIDQMADNKIFCRGLWRLISQLPMYQDCPRGSLLIAEDFVDRVLNLPSSPHLAKYFLGDGS